MSSLLIRARAGWEWFEIGSWNRMSQQAMVPLLVPVEEIKDGSTFTGVEKVNTVIRPVTQLPLTGTKSSQIYL